MVQIGVTPTEVQALMDLVNVQTIVKEKKVGEEGYIFVLDLDGTILAHPVESEVGHRLDDYSWGYIIEDCNYGQFTYEFNGIEKILTFDTTDKYIVVASVPTKEYYGHLGVQKNAIINVIIFTVVLACATIIILTNNLIIKRIQKILEVVTEIGRGNLNVIMPVIGQDELGQLAVGLDKMVDNLKSMVRHITDSAADLSSAADAAAEASSQVSTASNEIALSVNQIASGTNDQAQEVQISVEQLETVSGNVGAILGSTNIITEKVNEIEEMNTSGLIIVNQLRDKFIANKEATSKTGERINFLDEKSRKIETITETIKSISKQTKLLALNASIESARVGEAGKGFAVVADEIGKLAAQCAKAALEIEGLISEIKTDITEAVVSIKVTENVVEESGDKMIGTINTFHSLKESNDTLVLLTKELKDICGILKINTTKAMDSINTIASVSEETDATSEEISASAEEQSASVLEISNSIVGVKELTKGLLEMINKFKLD